MQCNIGRGPAWEEVFKQPSLKKSCKDLLLRHAVEKEDKKHQTGTSGLSAPMTAHKDLHHHHMIYSFLQNLENWVFWVAAGVAADVSGPKSHSTHHHPLKSSHLRSNCFFFAAKIVLFSTWMASSAKVEGMSPDQSPAAYLHRAPIRF